MPAQQVRIGLIDTGVDAAHRALRDATLQRWGCGGAPVAAAHGTAVASLLVGRDQGYRGAAPGAELFAADVYCGMPTGGAVDAIAGAFAWMLQTHVPVVNVSLVGARNAALEALVRTVIDHGVLIVAAVGNDGPAAPPLYPASFPGVVGVTAVDSHRRALLEAARGPQVMFAAWGSDLLAADIAGGYAPVRGTSFAAPVVAALLASLLPAPDPAAAAAAVAALSRQAIDLGPPGRDVTYGIGLVGADFHPTDGRNPQASSYQH
jgi:subtilisin family serine protease